jgi:hypothetical protein
MREKKYNNSTEHRPWEADSYRSGQKKFLLCIVHYIQVHYHVHSTPPLIPSMSLMNSVYTFPFLSLRSVLILSFHLLKRRKTISLKERIIVNACSRSYTLLLLLNGVQGCLCIWLTGRQSIFPMLCPLKSIGLWFFQRHMRWCDPAHQNTYLCLLYCACAGLMGITYPIRPVIWNRSDTWLVVSFIPFNLCYGFQIIL